LIDGGAADRCRGDSKKVVYDLNAAIEHVAAAVADAVALINASDQVHQDLLVRSAHQD
jgi:hypothetical protein